MPALSARMAARTAALAVAVVASSCGNTAGGPAPATVGTRPAQPPGDLTGRLTVFAAASLTEAFTDTKMRLQTAHPGLTIAYSFAGSQALVTQVANGAPADVVATADTSTMQELVSAGLVDAPRTFARNKLQIVVSPGNPKHVAALADLARGDLKVVLEDPSVPAGKYGRQALQAQGITAKPVSLPLDVKSELLAVEEGNADVGIVYVTDVTAAGTLVTGVPIPDSQNVVAQYPIAVVRSTANRVAAQALADEMVSGTGQQALRARGFLSP